ncbi:NUDIX domain-containing protein [Acetobacteraceae bacterium H6797]|nr:NUDIX domain-containing protein [Acetobacteraceae bacterium H6797]
MAVIVVGLLLRGGEVLLARRGPHRRRHPDSWSLPGGHAEPGESLGAALERELGEEIGILPVVFEAQEPVRNGPLLFQPFAVTQWAGEPRLLGEEHIALAWFGREQALALEDLSQPAWRPLIARLLA